MTDTILTAVSVFAIGIAALAGMTVIAMLVRRGGTWLNRENNLRAETPAVVVAKRSCIVRDAEEQPYTQYYVTYQLASGERVELKVSGELYGMTVEGDQGLLAYQGREMLGFDRVTGE